MATDVPKEELREIISDLSGIPMSNVIWDGEPVPFAAPKLGKVQGRLVLNVVATKRIGVDEATRTYPDANTIQLDVKGWRERTLSIKAELFGEQEGFDLLEDLRLELSFDETHEAFGAAGVSLLSSADVQNLDVSVDNREVSFAVLDIKLGQIVTKTKLVTVDADHPSYIETVGFKPFAEEPEDP